MAREFRAGGLALIWAMAILVSTVGFYDAAWGEVGDLPRQADYRFVRAEKVAVLSAEVDGVVAELLRGGQDFVVKGELLAQFDAELVDLEIKRFEAQIALNKEVEEEKAKVMLQYATENLEIVQGLYEKKLGTFRVGSPKEFKEAQERKMLAELEIKRVRGERRLLEIILDQARKRKTQHSVRAPMDGVLVLFSSLAADSPYRDKKQPQVGEMLRGGEPVAVLMKVDKLRVSRTLPVGSLEDVRVGQAGQVYVQGYEEALAGTVVFKSPTVTLTGEFDIEVEFANPRLPAEAAAERGYLYRFRPGIRARVELNTGE